jgi:hypothetical protein
LGLNLIKTLGLCQLTYGMLQSLTSNSRIN